MLINLRNAMMAGRRLPYDAEVEFLESTGTQWIDTGIISDGTGLTVEVTCSKTTSSTQEMSIVGRSGSDGFDIYTYNSRFAIWNSGSVNSTNPTAVSANEIYNVIGTTVGDTTSITVNGVISSTNRPLTFPLGNIVLFRHNNRYNWVGRIYSCKIWQNGVLVRDYIPVRKGTVGYLYDRVSGKLFGNAGTGDFVLGLDVVPVEWLEGGRLDSGIAFIDTGYTPNSSTKIESTSAILSEWGYSGRFGDRSRLTFGVGNGSLYLAQGNHYYLGGYTAGTFYSFVNDIPNRTVSVEGVGSTSTTAVSDWYSQLYPVYLFASNTYPVTGTVVNGKNIDPNSLGQIRMKSCSIWENNTLIRKFRPVRVGTDATSWEGAMMDVLTRRIYRNAGTGAFTYGNDLKYPIPAS